jgi:beta-lactam-binding protein with PASTA domain
MASSIKDKFFSFLSKARFALGETLSFMKTTAFWKNFGALVILVAIFFTIMFRFLGCYTHHGESVSVPNLVGMEYKQAKKLLSNRKLKIVLADSLYVKGAKPGTIVSQSPGEDEKVKRSRKVYVTVSTFMPKLRTVSSDLIGRSRKVVRQFLESEGFVVVNEVPVLGDLSKVGIVEKIEFDGKILFDYNKHYAERKRTGKNIEKELYEGSRITIHFIQGPGEEKAIPDVLGMDYESAKFTILGNDLNLGSVIVTGIIKDSSAAVVYKQYPMPDEFARIRTGEAVDIWISEEPIAPETE